MVPEQVALTALLDSIPCRVSMDPVPEGAISLVTCDSRQAGDGALFVALRGTHHDGHDFLAQVRESGCRAVVVEKKSGCEQLDFLTGICVITVDDSRQAYGLLAAEFYGRPAQGMTVVGITGTNGKTTSTYLLETVCQGLGKKVGVIGTISYRYDDLSGKQIYCDAPLTTPDPIQLQSLLREMKDNGVNLVLMEVSSHGLSQGRLGGIEFDVGVFTNLSHDHLDYHGTMAQYLAAKTLLFKKYLKAGGAAVLPADFGHDDGLADQFDELVACCRKKGCHVVRCGGTGDDDVRLLESSSTVTGSRLTLMYGEDRLSLTSPLVGEFNVENLVTAAGCCRVLGYPGQEVALYLKTASGAPGRLQRIAPGRDTGSPVVFVDFAHTPDALEKVLETLQKLKHRRLITVFGCGGDRDEGKRPLMGRVAAERSDLVIVTDDNPRSEDPKSITNAILAGIRETGMELLEVTAQYSLKENGCLVIPQREQAIETSLSAAGVGDIVLVAGKGHEPYQLCGGKKRFFDDSLEVEKLLCNWRYEDLESALEVERTTKGEDIDLSGQIVTDSRQVSTGDVFVALVGDRFDGHDFIKDVENRGAACLVVSDSAVVQEATVSCLLVKDTEKALGDLAAWRRKLMKKIANPVVAAITGSSGKTTVKEMTGSIFGCHWLSKVDGEPDRILKTQGNFNNLIGLPLSLLPIGPEHRAVILEMGMNRPGEIRRLAEIADPGIGCIVNVHGAHLEGLGTIEAVADAKEELWAGLNKDATLVVNLDDPRLVARVARYKQKKITFSLAPPEKAEQDRLWASSIKTDEKGRISFTLHVGEQQRQVAIKILGRHNISNGLAAAAIAHGAGVAIDEIAAGLEAFEPVAKRMEVVQRADGLTVINDTYNANPASMKAALDILAERPENLRIAILGDMLELGEESVEAHGHIGTYAAKAELDYLGLYGDMKDHTAAGAVAGGMEGKRVRCFSRKNEAGPWLEKIVEDNPARKGWVLVKGSRGMELETVVEEILGACL
ncbi:MAG: UDP-N-acetylmuramoyl-L-alanyl-D-glutamate--2,6-diaminopimelate ligase [Thermodesulfobacteriota bacterium]